VQWLPADLALVVGLLARGAIVLVTLLLVAPLVLGDERDLIGRIGVILLGALALGAVPLLANATAGALSLLLRQLKVGDELEIGSYRGRVVAQDLLAVELQEADGARVRVPHLYGLLRPARRRVQSSSGEDA
jgi:small-conductance mechanosensitive channel